jgi:hypothetical protein
MNYLSGLNSGKMNEFVLYLNIVVVMSTEVLDTS